MNDLDPQVDNFQKLPPISELTRTQRRVLGTLVEKAFTVPESYPLTLKAATTGCNQKNNRAPVTNYPEDAVQEALDQLRALGVAAVVHTESGRTERYRHYVRKRFPFSEAQLAIMTELWLRGRQQLGELRSRASRMAPIESQAELRKELDSLLEQGFIQSDGSLDRRGAEVDHTFYAAAEGPRTWGGGSPGESIGETSSITNSPVAGKSVSAAPQWEAQRDEIREEIRELREQVSELKDELAELRRNLGA